MKKISAYRILSVATKTLLTAVLPLLTQSCIMENGEDSPSADGIYLTLSVVTESGVPTRAGHSDDMQDPGDAAENFIDVDGGDLRIFLFDPEGNIIQEVQDTRWYKSTTGSSTVYTMPETRIFFADETEADKKRIESIKKEGISVLVLANSRNAGWNGDASSFSSLESLWKNNADFNFTCAPADGSLTWTPSAGERMIPMFGYITTRFSVTSQGIHKASGKINMQRAMAKVEVYDDITIDGVSISDVQLSDFNTAGRLIPDLKANPDWNKPGEQVGSSSLPSNPGHNSGQLKFFHTPGTKKWFAYIPEMQLVGLAADNSFPESRTHLNLTVSAPSEPLFDGQVYPVQFAKYIDNILPTVPDPSWNHILRNHIYRYSITKVGVDMGLELHVVPWRLDYDEDWDFTDHVMISRMLEWKDGSYESFDPETGKLLVWIDESEDKILEGTFRISSPLNGRWYARLTPLDGSSPTSLTFVDSKGKPMEPSSGNPPVCLEVSGIIEQEVPATIRIRPTGFGNEEASSFKLEFFVENLGVWINVPLVKDEYEFPFYTIVRNGNKIN